LGYEFIAGFDEDVEKTVPQASAALQFCGACDRYRRSAAADIFAALPESE
jgi:hypothetical protein